MGRDLSPCPSFPSPLGEGPGERSICRNRRASLMCAAVICSVPSKSAMVRATLSTRWYARAESRNRCTARSRMSCASDVGTQIRSTPAGSRLPLQVCWRCRWISRAAFTRATTDSVLSGFSSERRSWAGSMAFTRAYRSMRSNRGPYIRDWYRRIWASVHRHWALGSPR
jgi:hypothetical protein